jgi:hypothetical protein
MALQFLFGQQTQVAQAIVQRLMADTKTVALGAAS